MKKSLTCIFVFLIIFYFTNCELFGCLESDAELIKQTVRDLYLEISDMDKEILENKYSIESIDIKIYENAATWAPLITKRIELIKSGNIIVRSLETLFMKLSELKKLPFPWDFATGQTIAKILDDINEYTLKLNVFNRQIAELDEKITALENQTEKLKIEKAALELKNNGLKAQVKIKENQFRVLNLNLERKLTKIADVEGKINKVNLSINSYYNSIKILQARIDDLSSIQQGSMIPDGLGRLLSELAAQCELLAYALQTSEELHLKHGC